MHRIGDELREKIDSGIDSMMNAPGSPVAPGTTRRLLVCSAHKPNGRRQDGHASIDPANYAIQKMGEVSGAYVAYFSDDPAVLAPENLAFFHAVCFNNTAFRGNDFQVQDEVFQMKDHYSRDRLRVLLRIDVDKTDFGPQRRVLPERRADRDLAISWIRTEGQGRVFYTSLGHNEHLFWNPPVLSHYLAGLQYALGDLEVDATPRPMPA